MSAGGSHAAAVALSILRDGGNAVDAAIAGSAVQCVTELPWCGVAGDAFALVRQPDGATVAFNGSGAAPQGVLDALGPAAKVPRFGPLSVGVPATVDAWVSLHERFGSMPFADLLEPARRFAADGTPIDGKLSAALDGISRDQGGEQIEPLLQGVVTGDCPLLRQPDLAGTIEAIAASGRSEFYCGSIGSAICEHVARRGGAITTHDLANHRGVWSSPLALDYRGNVVSTNQPVSMGVLLLVCLAVLEHRHPDGLPDDVVDVVDELVRLKHLVFGELLPRLGDPLFVDNPDLLAPDAIAHVSDRLDHQVIGSADLAGTDTTSLAVSAPDGSAVTFIHSLFNEFGARELVPGTGIVLNDRLANLRPDGGANALVPGKRPMHTLHTYMVDRPDGSMIAGATPGGRGQVQTNLQVLIRVLDGDHGLQRAVTAPRWVNGMPRVSPSDTTLYVEPGLSELVTPLTERGHQVTLIAEEISDHFGNCTVVGRSSSADHHTAAADHRRHGAAQAF